MRNKSSIRSINLSRYEQCIALRKQGLSYSEIRKIIPVAKSTLQNWIALEGLTLTTNHLQLQLRKRVENKRSGTEASRITRARKAEKEIKDFIIQFNQYMNDSLLIAGVMLYEAEGAKDGNCRFSNSDYRLLRVFMNFLKRYFDLNKNLHLNFRLFIHETRSKDLCRIKKFWSKRLAIPADKIRISWKKNKVIRRRCNLDYKGQMCVTIVGVSFMARKMHALSSIILGRYCRVV